MRSKYPSRKNGRLVHCEGMLELDAAHLFELHPRITGYREQPEVFMYPDGPRVRRYTPDFEVRLVSGKRINVEIKPEASMLDPEVRHKLAMVGAHMHRLGEAFVVLTDGELRREPRQANVRSICLRASRVPPTRVAAVLAVARAAVRLPAPLSEATLTYGYWADAPREEQFQQYSRVDSGDNPTDIWGKRNLIGYTANGPQQYNYLDSTTTQLQRVFVSNDWTPDDKWTLTTAGAYTYVKREGEGYQHYGATGGPAYTQQYGKYSEVAWKKFTPSAGLKFQLDPADQFYLGYGRSFRAPVNGVVTQSDAVIAFYKQNPSELAFSGITPAQLAAIGNNNPEVADTIDLGWRYDGSDLSIHADAYGSDLKNKQVSGYDDASAQTVFLVVPRMRQRGFNAEASYKVYTDLSLYASYALTRSTIGENTATIGDGTYATAGKSFVNVSRNTFDLGASYTHGPFWAGLNANYRSSFWADWVNTEKAPGYATFDLNGGWNFPDVGSWLKSPKLKINVTNLTDKKALTFASSTNFQANKGVPDPTTGKDPSYISAATYNLLAPRAVMVSLSASFF